MKHFLSGFSDDDAKLILKHCSEVLPKSANILLLQVQCLPSLLCNNAVLPVIEPPACWTLSQVLLVPSSHSFSERHPASLLWCPRESCYKSPVAHAPILALAIQCALPVTAVRKQTLVMRADHRARGRRQRSQHLQGWRGARCCHTQPCMQHSIPLLCQAWGRPGSCRPP